MLWHSSTPRKKSRRRRPRAARTRVLQEDTAHATPDRHNNESPLNHDALPAHSKSTLNSNQPSNFVSHNALSTASWPPRPIFRASVKTRKSGVSQIPTSHSPVLTDPFSKPETSNKHNTPATTVIARRKDGLEFANHYSSLQAYSSSKLEPPIASSRPRNRGTLEVYAPHTPLPPCSQCTKALPLWDTPSHLPVKADFLGKFEPSDTGFRPSESGASQESASYSAIPTSMLGKRFRSRSPTTPTRVTRAKRSQSSQSRAPHTVGRQKVYDQDPISESEYAVISAKDDSDPGDVHNSVFKNRKAQKSSSKRLSQGRMTEQGMRAFINAYHDRKIRAFYTDYSWRTLRQFRADLKPWKQAVNQRIWDTNEEKPDGSILGSCAVVQFDGAPPVIRMSAGGYKSDFHVTKILAFGCGLLSFRQWEQIVRDGISFSASHRCHNAFCIEPTCITIESMKDNISRNQCKKAGNCACGLQPPCKVDRFGTLDHWLERTKSLLDRNASLLSVCMQSGCSFVCSKDWAAPNAGIMMHWIAAHTAVDATDPYVCNICRWHCIGMNRGKNHLKTHKKIHEEWENKPFRCTECRAGFKSLNTLRTHCRSSILHTHRKWETLGRACFS